MAFGFKARRLGLEFDLTVSTANGVGLGVRVVTYKHRLWAKPVGAIPVGTAASSVLLETNGGASRSLSSWVDSYSFNVLRLRYRIAGGGQGDIAFGNVQVFEYAENSDVQTYLTSYSYPSSGWLNAVAANGLGHQLITTFRSSNGGIAKIVFMHGIDVPAATRTFPSADSGIAAYSNFITAGDSCVRGIDGGRIVSGMRWNAGQDERWFKNVNRPNA